MMGRSMGVSSAPYEVPRRCFASVAPSRALPLWALALSALVLTQPGDAVSQMAPAHLRSVLDSLAEAHVASEAVPGVSVAVVHRGDTLLMEGYGYADVEWDVPTPADGDAVYEIGSVTKQFTAAAVLQLVDQGLLDLDAPFTDYLPDYNTGGREIPLRRLLDHTSGIKGYTEMPGFGALSVQALPRDSLLSLIAAEPFDFEPGTALIYNNSAYFIVGRIVEAVSGMPYEEYVQQHLFEAQGMARSSYCDPSTVIERRAHGYHATPQGLRVKDYLDHRWPYAAGSLCSTVGDLVRWNQALHGGRVLPDAAYAIMTTPMPLVDGSATRYAMGLGVRLRGESRVIAHGGGINGFLSDAQYFPDDDLLVVVLQNSVGPVGPGGLSAKIVEAVLGPESPPRPERFTEDAARYAGTYTGPARGRPLTLEVSVVNGALAVRPAGAAGEAQTLTYLGDGVWGRGPSRYTFTSVDGVPTALHVDGVGSHYVLSRGGG